MTKDEILAYLPRSQAVKQDNLSYVGSVDLVSSDLARWADVFVKPQQCYNNALNSGLVREDLVVVGYVLFPDVNIAIEHAWNYNEDIGHYDLTAQLHWIGGLHAGYQYVELIRFTGLEGWTLVDEIGGIDHMSLRGDKRYQYLFR